MAKSKKVVEAEESVETKGHQINLEILANNFPGVYKKIADAAEEKKGETMLNTGLEETGDQNPE